MGFNCEFFCKKRTKLLFCCWLPFFFTIYFSINACLYNIYIFTDKRFQLLILLKSSMTLYLIRRRCCCTVYFTYFKLREKKKMVFTLFSFFTLHAQNVLLLFFLLSKIASFILGKKQNIDGWERSTPTHYFYFIANNNFVVWW